MLGINFLRNILILGGVSILAYNLGRKGVLTNPVKTEELSETETFKTGSLSKDIERFQKNINTFVGEDVVEVDGAFSKKLKEVVNEVFHGTGLVINEETGEVPQKTIADLNAIIENMIAYTKKG